MNMQKEYKLIFSDDGVKKEEMTEEEVDRLAELNREVELQFRTERVLIGLKKCTEYCCEKCPYGKHGVFGYTVECMDKLMKDLYEVLQEHGVYDQFAGRLSAIERLESALDEACDEKGEVEDDGMV